MEISNSFEIPANPNTVWALLSDLPRIARCMPGAQIDGQVEGDPSAYTGFFALKVGPVRAKYGGVLRVQEMDQDAGRIVLSGSGTDAGGAGAVTATITGYLRAAGDNATDVELQSAIDVSGRLAQFTGRSSVVRGIADQIIKQFAGNLADEVTKSDPSASADSPQRHPSVANTATPKASTQPPNGSNELDGVGLFVSTLRDQVDLRVLIGAAAGATLGFLIGSRRNKSRPGLPAVIVVAPNALRDQRDWRG